MSDVNLFSQRYHIDDMTCLDHEEAARYVVQRVTRDLPEQIEKGTREWNRLAVCASGKHNIIVQLEGTTVKSFAAETREYPFRPAPRFYRT